MTTPTQAGQEGVDAAANGRSIKSCPYTGKLAEAWRECFRAHIRWLASHRRKGDDNA